MEAKAVEPASPAPDLTEEQRAALAAFAEMDADGDGELSADEIHRALSKNGEDVSLERVKELVAKADTDGNGLVSKQEYLDAIAADLVPQGWLGALGRRLAQLTARAEPSRRASSPSTRRRARWGSSSNARARSFEGPRVFASSEQSCRWAGRS